MPDLSLELATLRATPPETVRSGLSSGRSEALRPLYDDPEAGLDRLAGAIEAFWAVALAPYWPRIPTMLEGDILYRARRLAEGGARRLFEDLDPNIRWEDDTLRVSHLHVSAVRPVGGRGLLLVPSAFIWPRVFSVTAPPWQPTLRYPPRGIGTLWEPKSVNPSVALAGVLGRTRALLLAELVEPASTQDLARRTGLTAGGVSQHLTALHVAGLVTAHRTGRFVLYARTSTAEALLAGAGH